MPKGQPSASDRTGTAERRRHVRFLDEVKIRFRDIEGSEPSCWGRSRDLSLGGLLSSVKSKSASYCSSCYTGYYPVGFPRVVSG